MPRGIFGLRQTHDNQKAENWSVLSDVWLSYNGPFGKENPYGYFMGGDNNSRIFRLDFSNDTDNASIHAYSLDERDDGTAAFGNPNYAYITGGDTVSVPIDDTSIERLDYSNDTAGTVLMSGYSSTIRHLLVAIGNENYGYFGSGHNGGSPRIHRTKLDRYDYSTDTVINSITGFYDSTGTLTRACSGGAVVGNQFFAYFAGGYRGFGLSSAIRRLDYANDTDKVQPRNSVLTGNTRNFTASGDENGGYFMGGYSYPSPYEGTHSIVSRLDYTNDTNALSPKSNLPGDKYNHCSTGNSKFGYVAGGSQYPTRSLIYRLNYSNDTTTDSFKTVGNLGQTGTFQYGAGVSATENALGSQNLSSVPALTTRDTGAAPQGTDFGYSGGGRLPAITTVIDRFDYSNDTTQTQVKGGLLTEMEDVASVSSADFGYFAGGFNNFSRYSYVYRVDYSNDSANSVAKGNLSSPTGTFSAEGVGNSNFGYITGGGEPSITSNIRRIIYANDTTTQFLRGNLEEALFDHGAVGTPNFGYIAGGGGYSPPKSTIQRMQYADDTSKTLPKATLGSGGRNNLMATGNSEFGYFAGQFPSVSINERFDYSNDTVNAVTKGSLSSHRGSGSATGNQSKGYFMGGYDNNTALTSIVDRFDYSNDTADAVHTAYLSDSVANNTATSSRENAIPVKGPGVLFGIFEKVVDGTRSTSDSGFLHSGTTGSRISSIERIDYSNDTVSLVRGNVDEARQSFASVGNENFGYVAGGITPTSTGSNPTPYDDSRVERIDYLNDTATGLFRGPLSESRSGCAGVGNNSYGYVGGGEGGPFNLQVNISSIDRIDYSNDAVTASARFSPPTAIRRHGIMATGNQSYGYFAGGVNDDLAPDAPTSTVFRVNYASDTSFTTRGYLNHTAAFGAATGNANGGYIAGGTNYPTTPQVYYSSVSYIDYSNDLNQATPKGNLSSEQWKMAATGDANFGYFSGGGLIDTRARVDRIDYANDTVTASPKGRLNVSRYDHSSSSARANGFAAVNGPAFSEVFAAEVRPASTFGYFAGGDINPGAGYNTYTSVVDRITFDNDTVTAPARAPLPAGGKNCLAGVGSLNYGYTGGGYLGDPTAIHSKIERIDYTSDTGDMTHRANLAVRWGLAACGNVDKAYFAGGDSITAGYQSSRTTRIERFDYSNETVTAVGDLGFYVRRFCAVGTQSFGYFTGGEPSVSGGSRIERLSYSNDTTDTISMSNSNNPGWGSAATGNATYAYIGGGNQFYSRITRYDYANDTSTHSSIGNLVATEGYSLAATGNANFGYFGGNMDMTSILDRIDYSNDTVNASPKGPLSLGREELTGLSGGEDGNPQ